MKKDLEKRILEMENEYAKIYSVFEEDKHTITYKDLKLPDMYSHNFVYYKNQEGLYDYIRNTIENQTEGFFKLDTGYQIEKSFIDSLPIKPNITISDLYHIKTNQFDQIKGQENCTIVKASEERVLKDGMEVDIKANQGGMGVDFATKRIERKAIAYQDVSKPIDLYVCYHDGNAIGNIEYALGNNIVKLEDFDIIEEYQRQGFGSAILKHLLNVAYNEKITDAYLITDHSDTAKEMYEKCGFKKVGQKTELLFFFDQ